MPLHLLGKKSWNVYNPANIERVRRDEAAAQAREEEHDRRLDEYDATCRAAILRGEQPPSPPPELEEPGKERRSRDDGLPRIKRRKLAGENDTDRDIRVARQTEERNKVAKEQLLSYTDHRKATTDAPLTDQAGHINLFPVDAKATKKVEKNAEHEAEKARKEREFEDQYTMRFSNAAGREGLKKPWYADKTKASREPGTEVPDEKTEEPGRNVWGREDPQRKERDRARISTNDPLAFMKKAQVQLKEAQRDRKQFVAEREKDIADMITTEKEKVRSEGRRKHSRRGDIDDLSDLGEEKRSEHRSSQHRKKHRSRSRSRDRHRHKSHRDRSRSPERERHASHRSREKGRHRSHRSTSRSPKREGRHKSHHSSRRRSRSGEQGRESGSHRSSRH